MPPGKAAVVDVPDCASAAPASDCSDVALASYTFSRRNISISMKALFLLSGLHAIEEVQMENRDDCCGTDILPTLNPTVSSYCAKTAKSSGCSVLEHESNVDTAEGFVASNETFASHDLSRPWCWQKASHALVRNLFTLNERGFPPLSDHM